MDRSSRWFLDAAAAAAFACCGLLNQPAQAQKTVTQDAGGGQKQELIYDASGQMVETRTIGADGKLRQKNVFEFKPAGTMRQNTVISYWPDGKTARTISRETYDQNRNFIGEITEVFSQTGAHTGGHKLNHDPSTNSYDCFHWMATKQKYEPGECPSAEEGGVKPPPLAPLTDQEAIGMEASAEEAARTAEKAARMQRKSPVHPSPSAILPQIGVVLPAKLHAGEQVWGSIVKDPARYQGRPDLLVVPMDLPSNGTDEPLTLANWSVEVPGATDQEAQKPFRCTVPAAGAQLRVTLKDSANSSRTASREVKIGKSQAAARSGAGFKAMPLCIKGGVCVVGGPFPESGDNFASFEQTPARLLAADRNLVYLAVPEDLRSGPQHLLVRRGTKLVVFPVTLAELHVETDKPELTANETILGSITLADAGDLPDADWRDGAFPANYLGWAQSLDPEFKPKTAGTRERREPGEKDRDREEQDEAAGGTIVVVLQNLAPDATRLSGSANGKFVFRLTDESFKLGDFVYKFNVTGIETHPVDLKAVAIPLLAPVTGREVKLAAAEAGGS